MTIEGQQDSINHLATKLILINLLEIGESRKKPIRLVKMWEWITFGVR